MHFDFDLMMNTFIYLHNLILITSTFDMYKNHNIKSVIYSFLSRLVKCVETKPSTTGP